MGVADVIPSPSPTPAMGRPLVSLFTTTFTPTGLALGVHDRLPARTGRRLVAATSLAATSYSRGW